MWNFRRSAGGGTSSHSRTWCSRKKSDKVTLLYDPKDREKTGIVGFDAEWLRYSLIFGAGVLVILFSGWMYGWRN